MRGINFALAVLFGCVLLMAGTAFAGQDVRIFVEAEEAGASEPRPSAMRRALAQGVVQEAETLLQNELSEWRRVILGQVLAPRAEEYILGWEEIEYLPTEWGAVLHLNVRVNREALRGLLQSLGTYYTREQQIGYHLDTPDLVRDQLALLQELEVLSGVQRDGSDSLSLRLSAAADGSWQGILDYEGVVWSAVGQDLPEVWAGLWGNYFRQERVRQGFEDVLTLATHGWDSAADIQAFDLHLRGLDVSMDRIDLLGVSMQSGRYQATWRIMTMDRKALENSLRRYFQEQSATFGIE